MVTEFYWEVVRHRELNRVRDAYVRIIFKWIERGGCYAGNQMDLASENRPN